MIFKKPNKFDRQTARSLLKMIILGSITGLTASYNPMLFIGIIVTGGLTYLLYNAFMPLDKDDKS
jgi:hypothetical protein